MWVFLSLRNIALTVEIWLYNRKLERLINSLFFGRYPKEIKIVRFVHYIEDPKLARFRDELCKCMEFSMSVSLKVDTVSYVISTTIDYGQYVIDQLIDTESGRYVVNRLVSLMTITEVSHSIHDDRIGLKLITGTWIYVPCKPQDVGYLVLASNKRIAAQS